MQEKTENEIMKELETDKKNLEKLFGRQIKGFAVPFDYYSDLIESCVKKCAFEYARISEESLSFVPHKNSEINYYRWKSTIFHLDTSLEKLTEDFIQTDEELALFQIAGHTYDFDTENMWDKIETILKKISLQKDILPMTTIEIIDYLKAMEQVEITESHIINNSEKTLWFGIDGIVHKIEPKMMIAV
jgi:hypothetical protein